MNQIWITILVAAATAVVTVIIRESFQPLLTKVRLNFHRWYWKSRIPKRYIHRNKMQR